MDLNLTLEQIGLKQKQITTYVTLLQLGEATIHEIAAKTKIKRTTVYSILDSLIGRGLVTFIDSDGHRKYFAENPRKVLTYFKEKEHQVKAQQEKFADVLPELLSIYNVSATKPKIRFYEGVEGIKQIFEETLFLKKNEEMLAFSSATLIHKYLSDEWVNDYLARRVKRKIHQRAIVEDSPIGRDHLKNDAKENRQTRLVPKEKFPFSNEINVFGNKVSIVSYKDLMGVVIESADVSSTWRAIFELAWLGAKNLI